MLDVNNPLTHNSASKARTDSKIILRNLGFKELTININLKSKRKELFRGLNIIQKQLADYLNSIKPHSLLVVQYPWDILAFRFSKIIKKITAAKSIKTILLIHDLNSLRNGDIFTKLYYNYFVQEYSFINMFDFVIAHNTSMKHYLISKGVSENKIYLLNVFDYLINDNNTLNREDPNFRRVLIAGNLSKHKAGYIYKLKKLTINNYSFILYGNHVSKDLTDNSQTILYKGMVPADRLPSLLNNGFGLVWDGSSTQTCNGSFGKYLQFNNPYKFSLYLSSGIPVVVWSNSAIAGFVKENKLGLVISSLDELDKIFNDLTVEDYHMYIKHVDVIKNKVINGWYLTNAINKIVKNIND
ncbi:hypothetical protein [Limosilactobacillus sp.]|uniref:hypothetical protein n=1 Tax=Limosilactobacillus sp. TaxID=2773925 RepID=UPI00345EDBC8